jgi:hypothetical protein
MKVHEKKFVFIVLSIISIRFPVILKAQFAIEEGTSKIIKVLVTRPEFYHMVCSTDLYKYLCTYHLPSGLLELSIIRY